MSVRENVWVAQHSLPGVGPLELLSNRSAGERTRRRGEVDRMLDAVGLADRRDVLAGSLPLPEQRRFELARALVRSPALLLLDEPAGGMTPAETAEMAALIRDFALPGRTCIVIEHKLDLILRCVSASACSISAARSQTVRRVLQQAEVLEAYLGRDAAHA